MHKRFDSEGWRWDVIACIRGQNDSLWWVCSFCVNDRDFGFIVLDSLFLNMQYQ